ncbi:hypothetical protein [Methylobacterium sp. E-066]|uniref:hypothetical protein n=1 Tax=Methylobacterium sp. E-066 TaxID=2836584 RepID=UPI001FB90D49|nr:hypothetical protein [Methylobacterium sp. E-066]MCJ2141576.1 hypothetical protein [Methylobacterium sp. E-066]
MKTWFFGLGALAIGALAFPGAADAETFSLWVRSDGSTFMPKVVEAFNASQSAHKAELQIVPVNCPSSDDLGHSAVFRSGGSGPSGVRG